MQRPPGRRRPTTVEVQCVGVALALLTLVGCATHLTGDRPDKAVGSLRGVVAAYGGPVGARNGPVPHQRVALVDAAGHAVATAMTDETGHYLLVAHPGTYRVLGDVCTQAVHQVTLPGGEPQTLDLTCQMR
jgi:hypothetical protein